MKRALILGASGFIGMAATKWLKAEGVYVCGVDYRSPPFETSIADDFVMHDLRLGLPGVAGQHWDYVLQLACDMGGAGYIFTGEHDADVMSNNVRINVNVARAFAKVGCGRLLYTSSSCVYNDDYADLLADTKDYFLHERDAGARPPSNCYGWEKFFCEQLYDAYARNYGLNVCITRFSTIYGPGSAFDNGREKAVAAICRKVLDAPHGGDVEVWGDGDQLRPLVYIDDLVDAITRLMRSSHTEPMNIATTELTSCNEVARQAIALSNKRALKIKNVPGPIGKQVLQMTTDQAETKLGWKATTPFAVGLERTFEWIATQKMRQAA